MSEAQPAAPVPFVSPVAEPLLDGKALRRSLKLIQAVSVVERGCRSKSKEGSRPRKAVRLLRRGVHEVTKSLKKGETGIVFFASDVYPIEILAHIPILCEEKGVPYAYICPKKALGHAFRSKRPASVIMLAPPPSTSKKGLVNEEGESRDEEIEDLQGAFEKVERTIRKNHPYL
ncbi:H/ACA ribonucleoprotein complex subunit NHP2 [Cyclospora cayetanensis]|uniref:H/ACA ribonucleoprotein complex subunit NHP2 n=2 Tax=Cyclospora cayetanensis TaxID=88456 RepID=A0A6P5WDV7_9EIME|nr:H/ACA ribonucleoprotein complex subunit NHP2 [Cyclospora cayetanensis]OEH78527.1 60s ribosomal protein [Cyclospora cayetanensis]